MKLLLFALVLNGCALYAFTHPDKYTPEQLQELNRLGLDVYQCLYVQGPPPIGGYTLLTVPRGRGPANVKFDDNCRIREN